ncbi:MAG: carbamoyltransferase HypF, partial [Candidatus Bathyarchaeota archaeon]
KEKNCLSELIAPRLHNIGVMLPYTGLHEMLFDKAGEPAFVMTSANPPSEPIVINNEEAIKTLGSTVDYFLFHTRIITQRCDDSVIRLHEGRRIFTRRSRGYAPTPISLKDSSKRCVLGVGAKENVNACVILNDRAFISQYIGDVENLETIMFLKTTISHLLTLTNAKIDFISCDLHPKFATTKLAHKIGAELGISVLPVQHHHAHALSLMGENALDAVVCIVCDGYGYGADGSAWGGEILLCEDEDFRRVGHLEEQPLVGGDLASRYPVRMAAGILKNPADIQKLLLARATHFPYKEDEAVTILDQLQRARFLTTTSCGRILDAASAILDLCYERTYQGEPAMKLESAAVYGRDVLSIKPQIASDTLATTNIIEAVFNASTTTADPRKTADLAFSVESYLAKGLAQIAITAAQDNGVSDIGFSGGVSYNKHITIAIKNIVEENGLRFYMQKQLPPGDGGISFGQALAASAL